MNVTEDVKNEARHVNDKAQKLMHEGKEKMKETSTDIRQAGKGVAGDVKDRAVELKHNLTHKQ
ncbi:MAG: hypothetical protein JWN26_517 [Candidatus Saccharibacteria bacterium]|nr:hypothetical protein [Candidatus Saccharibacteria bacterium]